MEYSCLASTGSVAFPWDRYFKLNLLSVLLSYDWMLTLRKEVQLIWLRRWGGVSILFFLVRYSSLATWGLQMVFSLNTFPGNVVSLFIYGIYITDRI